MADSIQFTDNRVEVKGQIEGSIRAFLLEIGGEFQAQTMRNSRVKTGQTKGSWDYQVDEAALTVTIGSPLENAIWEEFGTLTPEVGTKENRAFFLTAVRNCYLGGVSIRQMSRLTGISRGILQRYR